MKSLKNQCEDVLWKAIEENGNGVHKYNLYGGMLITAMVVIYRDGSMVNTIAEQGEARCCPSDRYNVNTGEQISTGRAIRKIAKNKNYASYIVKKYGHLID